MLVSHPSQDRVDRYGRLLRYVVKRGHDVNRVASYRKAQAAAKQQHRGIWSRCR